MNAALPGRALGFTLIELLVALVIVAILSALAIPNYSAYVSRGKRAAAKTELLNAAQALERNYTASGCYNFVSVAACRAQSGAAFVLPSAVAPGEGRASHAIAVDYSASATGQAYALTATPCAAAGICPAGSDAFADAECGALGLNQAGSRSVSGSSSVANCWQR